MERNGNGIEHTAQMNFISESQINNVIRIIMRHYSVFHCALRVATAEAYLNGSNLMIASQRCLSARSLKCFETHPAALPQNKWYLVTKLMVGGRSREIPQNFHVMTAMKKRIFIVALRSGTFILYSSSSSSYLPILLQQQYQQQHVLSTSFLFSLLRYW